MSRIVLSVANRLSLREPQRISLEYGGKPWRYLLIPHNEIVLNMTLAGLSARYQ